MDLKAFTDYIADMNNAGLIISGLALSINEAGALKQPYLILGDDIRGPAEIIQGDDDSLQGPVLALHRSHPQYFRVDPDYPLLMITRNGDLYRRSIDGGSFIAMKRWLNPGTEIPGFTDDRRGLPISGVARLLEEQAA